MNMNKIKVLVVDDSAFMRRVITEMLNSDAALQVIATANDGLDAVKKIEKLKPDVVTLDVEMPKVDGLTALCYIMAYNPLPVVMLSAMDKLEADLALKAIEYGAVDFVSKPGKTISLNIDEVKDELIAKVKTASTVNVKKIRFGIMEKAYIKKMLKPPKTDKKVLVIGASTGGPYALSDIIPKLHRNFPLAVLIVQHMPLGFTKPFSERLAWCGSIAIKEAANNDLVRSGQALLAPAGYHIIIKRGNGKQWNSKYDRIWLNKKPKVNFVRPSIDVTMSSVAEAYKDKVIGVLLSGMGKDGAKGLKAIKDHGGTTIVQDELTSVVFGMPKAAIELGVVDSIVPQSKVVDEILKML